MKNKIVLLDNDMYYANKIVNILNDRYPDEIEAYAFTRMDLAINFIKEKKIYMLIMSEGIDIEEGQFPSKCGICYLVEDEKIDMINGKKTICKFQKIDSIFRQIKGVCAEYTPEGMSLGGGSLENIITFCSPAGGVGCTSAAVACARYLAARQKKTLYLNLEKTGSTDLYFHGQGREDFSDVIYALKGGKGNMSLKLESIVRQDVSGVHFFESTKNALDNCELTKGDIERLLQELKSAGNYQIIVIDINFNFEERDWTILTNSSRYIMVADGKTESNRKCEKAYHAIMQKINDESVNLSMQRMSVFYNRFSNRNGVKLTCPDLEELGGSPKIEASDYTMIIDEMSKNDSFGKLL